MTFDEDEAADELEWLQEEPPSSGIFLTEGNDEEDEAELLADGTLDPDEVDPWLEPYDEGSDDEV